MKSLIAFCLLVGVAFALPVFDDSAEFDSDDTTYGADSDEAFAGPVTYSTGPVFRSGTNFVARYEADDDDDDDDDTVYRAYYAGAPAVTQQKSLAVQTYSAPVATYSAPVSTYSAPMSYAAPTVYSVPQSVVYSVAQPKTYSVNTAVPSSGTSFYYRRADDSAEVPSFYNAAVPAVYSAPQVYSTPQVYSAPQVSYSVPHVSYSTPPTVYSSAPRGYVYYGDDDDDDRFDFD